MKRILYLFAFVVLFATRGTAQYTITASNIINYPDSSCTDIVFNITASSATGSLSVRTYYGDGTENVIPLSGAYAMYYHTYAAPGVYTVKRVLLDGTNPVDSVLEVYNYLYCQILSIRTFYDANNNGVFDAGDGSHWDNIVFAVDSNGVTVDTIDMWGMGWDYSVRGNPGDIYAFRAISSPGAAFPSIPLGGVIYDTISTVVNAYIPKYFGFNYFSAGWYSNDLRENIYPRASRHSFMAMISVDRMECTTIADTLTMNLSPKYIYSHAYPAPTSISGNVLKWIFPASPVTNPLIIAWGEVPGADLTLGDTVHSSYYLNTPAGDIDLTNNTVFEIDTVKSSFDPNEKSVTPSGILTPGNGTLLTYTLKFENTGNDTAFNIHIMDTLSDYLDVHSLKVLTATHPVTTCVLNDGLHNVLKFDFPHINLLDSSYHGLCDGMVRFTIKSQDGLLVGTHIDNRVGIYFDYNPVVMTNTVTNIVGWPAGIEEMSNVATAALELFPNPASNELTVKITNGNYSTISVINSVGQEVMKQEVNGINTKLNIKALPAGGYYISVKGNSGVKVERFQKI